MKYKVIKKQNNGKKCIVCGLENNIGLKTSFYELENGKLVGICTTKEEHQSYPGRLHGGISSALLDETIGRAISINNPEIWGVTIDLNTKFRKPVPLDEEIKIIGEITKETRRGFEGEGKIILANGEVAVTAWGRYIKMDIDKITNTNIDHEEWILNLKEDDPTEIEIFE
ncbi:PaaI family thioesterase [Clostridium tarantellae]|uniref:Acyl-coenzyme A thioesterase THEM4 n=1 Tax=Clostridium tarantellae TaxID=39493 RepID=A0A6I1MRI8_9CLOT|nr:PaaI family thioesterase [Clostridium tarantellae]MPQ45088.1 PaaI family thioesterase [Clostridium tarantellae]